MITDAIKVVIWPGKVLGPLKSFVVRLGLCSVAVKVLLRIKVRGIIEVSSRLEYSFMRVETLRGLYFVHF